MIIAPLICWYLITLLIKIHYLEVEMRNLATCDSLTKTMSRKTFLTNGKLLYKLDKRDASTLAVLYIDIDNFKKINDTYGHSTGDEVLKSFGSILNNNKRDSDIVGRLGGEEFAFVLPKTNKYGALQFADNLREIIKKQTIKDNNTPIKYTASIGISILDKNNKVSFEELLKQSDEALYRAKRSGKDCTIIYESNTSLENDINDE